MFHQNDEVYLWINFVGIEIEEQTYLQKMIISFLLKAHHKSFLVHAFAFHIRYLSFHGCPATLVLLEFISLMKLFILTKYDFFNSYNNIF